MHVARGYSDVAGRTRTRAIHERVQLRFEAGVAQWAQQGAPQAALAALLTG